MLEAGRRYSDAPTAGVSLGPVDTAVLARLVSDGFARYDATTVSVAGEAVAPGGFVRGGAPLGPARPSLTPDGALVNPATGDPVPNNMQATEPKSVTPSGPYAAGATGSQTAPGTIGTLTASPTLAEILARQLRVDFGPDTRAISVDLTDWYAAKAAGALLVSVHAPDEVAAAGDFLTRDPRYIHRVQPGREAWFGVGPDDPDIAYAHIVHEYATGSGYTDISTVVRGYDQAVSNALIMDSQSDLLSQLTQKYIYVPMHDIAGSTAVSVQSNISGANLTETLNGTTTNVFSTRGQATPVGDNYVTVTGASNALSPYTALGNLKNLGGLLIMLQFKITTSQSSGVQSMVSRNILNSAGGFDLAYDATRKPYVRYRANGGSIQETAYPAVSASEWHALVVYYDCVAGIVVPYLDGTALQNITMTGGVNLAPTPPTGNVLNLLRQSGGAANNYMGNNSGVIGLSEVMTIHCEFDLAPFIADIASEFIPGIHKPPLRALLRAGV